MAKQSSNKIAFEFKNQVSPGYIEPLLLQLEQDRWYGSDELKEILWASGSSAKGDDIVLHNMVSWHLMGLGNSKLTVRGSQRRRIFRLTTTGKQLSETYSTNRELFFDLMHYMFYTTWLRSQDVRRVRFWIYTNVCASLWHEAPALMDSFKLTNRLHAEATAAFPAYEPAFPERSVRSIFPWLVTLTPPFLEKVGIKSQYQSKRRNYCTPQLFHLATDLIYNSEQLSYGTSMALSEKHIEDICKACLLDPTKFWSIADLTAMMIREFSIQRGQWGRSIVLSGPPTWINLPDFAAETTTESEDLEDEPKVEGKRAVEATDDLDDDEEGEL